MLTIGGKALSKREDTLFISLSNISDIAIPNRSLALFIIGTPTIIPVAAEEVVAASNAIR